MVLKSACQYRTGDLLDRCFGISIDWDQRSQVSDEEGMAPVISTGYGTVMIPELVLANDHHGMGYGHTVGIKGSPVLTDVVASKLVAAWGPVWRHLSPQRICAWWFPHGHKLATMDMALPAVRVRGP